MARPKSEEKTVERDEIIQLRGPNDNLLPVAIEFPVYEAVIDEQIAQYDLLAKKEADEEVKETYNDLTRRLRGTVDDAPKFSAHCIPIIIGEHNEYVVQNTSVREIVKKHLCKPDGSAYFDAHEDLKPGAFVQRAYEAIMEASGYSLSKTGMQAMREVQMTTAQLRIKELKKKVNSTTKDFEKSASATGLPSGSDTNLGRSPA